MGSAKISVYTQKEISDVLSPTTKISKEFDTSIKFKLSLGLFLCVQYRASVYQCVHQ